MPARTAAPSVRFSSPRAHFCPSLPSVPETAPTAAARYCLRRARLVWPVGRGNPCATVCWTGRGTSTLRNRSRRGATPARCRPIELALPWQAVTACRREQARCVAGPWRQTVSASAITPKSLSPIRASDEWRRCRYTPTWEGLELTLERRKKLQLFSLAALGL